MRRFALILAVLAVLPAAAANAATWTPLTGSLGSNIHEAGQVRSADGTLHVVWTRDTPGAGTNDVYHVSISPTGLVSSVATVASGFASAGNPAIVNTAGGGLAVFFGGIQCTSTSCPQGLFQATSTDGGTTWSTPVSVLPRSSASDVNAATLSDGTPFQTWWGTAGVFVNRGVSATSTGNDFQGAMGAACCGYYSNLAGDGGGHMQLAWDSNATGFIGTWSRAVDPTTGAPSGAPMLMPGSVTQYAGSPSQSQVLSRTPIVALPGASGQFFVAYPGGYPETTQVLLWHVGAASSTTVVSEAGNHNQVSLAVDAQSRLWVFWTHDTASGVHVFARRIGAAGMEPVIDLGAPAQASSIYAIDGSVAPNGDPEVLALVGRPDGTDLTYYSRGPQTAPVLPPVLGKSFDVAVVSGQVFVKLPPGYASDALAKGSGFVALTQPRQLPAGTSVDARAGSLTLVAATGQVGKTQSGVFAGGVFKLAQDRGGLTKGLTTLSLLEGAFKGGPSYAQCGIHGAVDPTAGQATLAAANPRKILQTLHASDNHGRFRTRTRASAATVRGTVWDTIDQCGGTVTRVKRGTVDVFAFRLRKTIVVRAGHSYYAKLP